MHSNKRIIFIAGAPAVGKSTIAQALSTELNLPWISTDHIREVMWSCADKNSFKKLFNAHDITETEYYSKYSESEIVQKEIEQAEDVWIGIKQFIDNNFTWKSGFIIEGVAILPYLFIRDYGQDKNVKLIVISEKDSTRIRETIFTRGLWSGAKRYSDNVKEKEVRYVTLFNEWFEEQARLHNLNIVTVQRDGDDLRRVLDLIK